MKKNKFFHILVSCFLIATLASCSKSIGEEARRDNSLTFVSGDSKLAEGFLAFFKSEKIGPELTLAKSGNSTPSLSGYFSRKYESPTLLLSNNEFFRNSFPISTQVNPDATVMTSEDLELNGLFGTKAFFNINLPGYGKWQEELYVPHKLQGVKLGVSDGQMVSRSGGMDVYWSADNHPLNDKGVLIELTYVPSSQFGSPASGQIITQYVVVSDNGYYRINSNDLANLPANSNININIYRGNYKTIPFGKSEEIALLAYDKYYSAFSLSY